MLLTKKILAILILLTVGLIAFKLPKDPFISSLILPHHDIVAEERYELLEEVAEDINGRPIILASPNHYQAGSADIQTRTEVFETRHGQVEVSPRLVEIAQNAGAVEEFGGFSNEHGIYTVLSDLARLTPDSKILPLVINESTDSEKLDELFNRLYDECSDCVFIASADMSHYQPYLLSELHDRSTIQALNEFDKEFILEKAEVGPPHIVYQAMRWAERAGTEKFELFNHTNSTIVVDQPFSEGTTHIFGWFESGSPNLVAPNTSFTFVGDINFSGSLAVQSSSNFQSLVEGLGDRVLWGTDVVAGNLEGPITNLTKSEPLQLTNSPRSVPFMDYLHFTHLFTLNNHQMDAGQQGVEDTSMFLDQVEIGLISQETEQISDIVLINYDASSNHRDLSQQIANQPEEYKVVVYAHWGNQFIKQSNESQRLLAQSWIDAGADLVVGTGSHVIGEVEVYNSVPIFYSLGNFIYDELFNPDENGLVISGYFSNDELYIIPSIISFEDNRLLLMRNQLANDQILDRFPDLEANISDTTGGISFTFPAPQE